VLLFNLREDAARPRRLGRGPYPRLDIAPQRAEAPATKTACAFRPEAGLSAGKVLAPAAKTYVLSLKWVGDVATGNAAALPGKTPVNLSGGGTAARQATPL